MTRLRWLFALAAAVAVSAVPALAQGTGTITGTVIDRGSRQPIAGAQVNVAGTSVGSVTNAQGAFTLAGVPVGARTVRASRIGYREATAAVTVSGTPAQVTLELAQDVLGLDEVVVVGYGQERRRNVAGAVSSIRPTEVVSQTPTASVQNILQGRVSGVQIVQNSGTPGAAITVRVRGASSISAGNQPLYVVDGVPLLQGNLSTLNGAYGGQGIDALADLSPTDIESMEVLKDASAAAIYGSRASNGVVIITTKKGRAGQRPEINFSSYYGTQEMWRKPEFLNAEEYIAVTNEGFGRAIVGYEDDNVRNAIEVKRGINTDWIAAVTQDAPVANLTGSISGGTERVRYYVTGSQFDQTGFVLGTGYNRLNGRVNLDYTAGDRLTLGTNVALTRSVTDRQRNDNTIYGPFANAIASAPVDPVYNEDGSYYLTTIGYDNPVALGKENPGQERSIHILANAFASLDLAEGLSARAAVGVDQYNLRSRLYDSPIAGPAVGTSGSGRFGDSYANKLLTEGTLNYSRDLGNGSLSGVMGASLETNSTEQHSVQGTGFPSSYFKYLTSAATITSGSTSLTEWELLSYFGRASYNWNEQVTATFNVRMDGSSRFGANNRYGVFPSGSLLWRVTNAGFMQSQGIFSDLALRASYGRTGNQQGIGDFASRGLVGGGFNYANQPGLAPVQLANPDLSWEKTDQLNLGADLGFLNDRLGFSVDWYHKNTTDLLLNRPVPYLTGFAVLTSNIGAMVNKGVEVSARALLLNGGRTGLNWTVEGNVSHNDNKVTALYNDEPFNSSFASRVEVGQPIGVFYGWKTAGIFQSAAEVKAWATQTARTAPGDVKFVDLNGRDAQGNLTGQPDGRITDDDRTIIGSPWPDYVGGVTNTLSYGGVDLSVFMQFSQGNEIFNANRIYTDAYGYGGLDNFSVRARDRWTPTNPSNTEPRAVAGNPNRNNRNSDRFIEDGSYVRMKNVVLGYNLPSSLGRRFGFGDVRVYLQGQNLITWTEYSGFDPEVNFAGDTDIARGIDFYTMPQTRTLTAGINIRL